MTKKEDDDELTSISVVKEGFVILTDLLERRARGHKEMCGIPIDTSIFLAMCKMLVSSYLKLIDDCCGEAGCTFAGAGKGLLDITDELTPEVLSKAMEHMTKGQTVQ